MPTNEVFDHNLGMPPVKALDQHYHMATDEGMPEPPTKFQEAMHDHPADLIAQNAHEGVAAGRLIDSEYERRRIAVLKAAREPWNLGAFSHRNRMRSESLHGFDHKLNDWSLNDWMTALVGEVGEAANVLKKMKRITGRSRGNRKGETLESLTAKLASELADAFIYLDLLVMAAGMDMPTIVEAKFAEVSAEIGYVDPLKPL